MNTVEPILTGLRLKVIDGAFHQEHLALERSLISLGRSTPESPSSAAYLTFPEPTVSRLHAVLTWEAGVKAFLLHHRSQTNPTLLNNTAITGPELLKAGDTVTLGRLVLLVEADSTSSATAAPATPAITLNAKTDMGDRTFNVPLQSSRISVVFGPDRSTTPITPPPGGQEVQEIRFPAPVPTNFQLQLTAEDEENIAQGSPPEEAPVLRVSRALGMELHLPLKENTAVPILYSDLLLHQRYRLWLGNENSEPGRATLSEKPGPPDSQSDLVPHLILRFLNGPWCDTEVTIPAAGSYHLPLGPGFTPFRHPFPFPHTPSCSITVADGFARLRVSKVDDDQFIEVDGDLVFESEAVTLVSGSRILLGDAEFLWTDPTVHAVYTAFCLTHEQSVFPIRKSTVRIGTAAHCEVMLSDRSLPPVLGRIDFGPAGPVYHHLNIAAPIRVDSHEISAGLSTELKNGSNLELSPSFKLKFQNVSETKD